LCLQGPLGKTMHSMCANKKNVNEHEIFHFFCFSHLP
jgi:hypothetical protein